MKSETLDDDDDERYRMILHHLDDIFGDGVEIFVLVFSRGGLLASGDDGDGDGEDLSECTS